LYQKNLAEYETNPDPAVLKNWTFKVDNGSAVANPLAQLNAFYQAVTQASGREGCILNLHASGKCENRWERATLDTQH